jgi:nicotinamidase-related amidase
MQLSLDPHRTAVLSMDYQTAIVSIYSKDPDGLLARASSVLRQARRAGIGVIHVRVGFRPNVPEISSRNKLFAAIKGSVRHQQIFEGAAGAIHTSVAPEGDDLVIIKHRVDAFVGTDLGLILRAKDIHTLILFGIATSGVVLSTLLRAADEDYRLVAVGDCCADLDPELHSCLIDRLFPRHATVVSASELIEALTPAGSGPVAVV